MDNNSTKRQEQRQFVTGGVRSTPGSARGRRLGFDVGVSSRRPRATAPGLTTTASWNSCRRPNNGDVNALHVVDSTASATQLHTSATTVHCRRRTIWVDDAGSGHAHSSHGFNQLAQTTNNLSRRPFVRQINFKTAFKIARFCRRSNNFRDPQTMRELVS